MTFNALGRPGDAGSRPLSPGYGRAIDGLRSFDDISRALAAQHDAVVRRLPSGGSAYPQPAYHSAAAEAGTVLGAALAAFAGSESGRAAIEAAGSAVARVLGGIFGRGGGPEQLRLPFE